MRKREREQLAGKIRNTAEVLRRLLDEAAKAGMEVDGPWNQIGEWHELDRIHVRITYPAVEEL